MTYIYRVDDGKKSFYFRSKQKDSSKAIQNCAGVFGKCEPGGIIRHNLFEIFDDFYRITLVWSHCDKNVSFIPIMKDMIYNDLPPQPLVVRPPRPARLVC